jgi:Putative metal-binding motif
MRRTRCLLLLPVLFACDGKRGGDGADSGLSDIDADGDRYFVGEDCDDSDADVHPGGTETCDGVDDDCDGSIDEDAVDATTGWLDADADGYGDPGSPVTACDAAGIVNNDLDCDDEHEAAHPGATEVCDAQDADEDCNGVADDVDPDVDPGSSSTWYTDADGDGYGDPDLPSQSCDAPAGAVANGDDCDDGDPLRNPDAPCESSTVEYEGEVRLEVRVSDLGVGDVCEGTLEVSLDSDGVITGTGECGFLGLLSSYGDVELTVDGSASTSTKASGTLEGNFMGISGTPEWEGSYTSTSMDGEISGSGTLSGYTLSYDGDFSLTY